MCTGIPCRATCLCRIARYPIQEMVQLTDNFLDCQQSPLNYTADADQYETLRENQPCGNCKIRISSLIAGTGFVRPHPQGLSFDSPQTALEFNGVRHSIIECVLTFPAMHHIDVSGVVKFADISDAELQVKFRGDTSATLNSFYTLVIPINTKITGKGVDLFASLDTLGRSKPTMGSVLPTGPFLMYKGVDIDGLTVSNKNSACADTRQKVNYLVSLTPLHMLPVDLIRLKKRAGVTDTSSEGNAAKAGTSVTTKLPLLSYIPSITVNSSLVPKTVQNGYVQTAQVKCRPLAAGDIKGDKVYVGGPGTYRSLEEELKTGGDPTGALTVPDASFDVSRVESILAITIGVIVGIVVVSLIGWGVFRMSKRYLAMTRLYDLAKIKDEATSKAVKTAINSVLSPGK